MSSPSIASSWAFDFVLDNFCSFCFFISTRSFNVTFDISSRLEKSISPLDSFSSCSFLFFNSFSLFFGSSRFGKPIFSWTSFRILSVSSCVGRMKCVFALWFFRSLTLRCDSSLRKIGSKSSGIFPFSISWIVCESIWVCSASWLIVSFFLRRAMFRVQ